MTVQDTLDAVEDTLDGIEYELGTVKGTKNKAVFVAVALVSAAAGAAVSYFLTKRKYEEIVRQEIAEAKEYYARNTKPGTPEELLNQRQNSEDMKTLRHLASGYQSSEDIAEAADMVEQARSSVEDVTGRNVEVDADSPGMPPEIVNIFTQSEPKEDFDFEAELPLRSEENPYIITHDEFMANETDYQQVQVTYYEGDDVLSDERDQVIEDTEDTVGNQNLLKFGHGSKDNNIVFIRNDRLSLEFEVVRSQGKYAEQVLGFIEHSERDRRPRRFRNYDD
jgi:hypothetical protein